MAKKIKIQLTSEREILARTKKMLDIVMPKMLQLLEEEKILALPNCEIDGSLSFLLMKLEDDGSLSFLPDRIQVINAKCLK